MKTKIQFYNEWKQFFQKDVKWNWQSFTIVSIELERDYMFSSYEILFMLLGFGFRISFYSNTMKLTEIEEEIKRRVNK